MALFSELDWLIIAGVGAFLFLGPENRAVMRELGRWYGRAVRLKRELLSDLSQAAEIPPPTAGRPASLRQVLLEGLQGPSGQVSGIPAAVPVAPTAWTRPAPTVAVRPVAGWAPRSSPDDVQPGWAS